MAQRRPSVPRTRRPEGSTGPSGSVPVRRNPDSGRTDSTAEHIISAEKDVTETGEHQLIRADFGHQEPAPATTENTRAEEPKPAQTEAPEAPAARPPSPSSSSPVRKNRSEQRAQQRTRLSNAIRKGRTAEPTSVPPQPPAEPVPAKRFSGRLLALAVVLITIIVMLAPSVRVYIQQRSEIAALENQIADEQDRAQELESQVARWDDPAFIKQQARERLFLVMPGETRYLVKGLDGFEESEREVAGDAPQDLAWVDALWNSVQRSATAQ